MALSTCLVLRQTQTLIMTPQLHKVNNAVVDVKRRA